MGEEVDCLTNDVFEQNPLDVFFAFKLRRVWQKLCLARGPYFTQDVVRFLDLFHIVGRVTPASF